MDIDTMQAGRELNLLIAEKIFGWHWEEVDDISKCYVPSDKKMLCPPGKNWDSLGWHVPLYSTDITAAFEVVEKLKQQEIWLTMEYARQPESKGMVWTAHFRGRIRKNKNRFYAVYGIDDNPATAICRAAYKAVTAP
ncbi:MAG TPA: hypothetical protein DCZ10_16040 [Pelotomaculum sp.]|nr:hypothetical protein [Pelotomaculum sp.]